MSANRHAIIAGVNKCGTTSVFRYLAEHPQVSASRVKETRFFVKDNWREGETCYLDNFGTDVQQGQLLLEASPTYFTSGKEIGIRIRDVLPDVRIIVLLRNPIERLISYYRSTLVYDNYANEFIRELSFSEFVDSALDALQSNKQGGPREEEFKRAFEQGNYARHIQEFGVQFQKDQVRYFFFEDLVEDAKRLMMNMSDFLEIDRQFFEDYLYSVENKSRAYRSMTIQKFGYRLNMRLEPFLNSNPRLRKLAQTFYRNINEKPVAVRVDDHPKTIAKLTDYYYDDIIRLGQILRLDKRVDKLPAWLNMGST